MAIDVFRNSTKSVPTSDAQIVRVDMEQLDIGGRKSHLPATDKNNLSIDHVPSRSTTPGGGK
jgi:hypothetical protein